MKPAANERDAINDPATQLALERLAESRLRLAGWTAQMAAHRAARRGGGMGFGFGSFQPRSKTLQMLMSLVMPRVPWMRWGLSALLPLLLRFWRRR
jgi:hypothetical protein